MSSDNLAKAGKESKIASRATAKIANRIDAYRLLKVLAQEHGFEDFALIRFPAILREMGYKSVFDLHSLAEIEMEMLDLEGDCAADPLIAHLVKHAAPFEQRLSSDDMLDISTGMLRHFSVRVCVAFNMPPLATSRYAMAFFSHRDTPENRDKGGLLVDALECYDALRAHLLKGEKADEFDERDAAILALTSEGMTSQQIAAELNISEHTVNANVAGLIRRFGVINRPQLIATAIRKGLIG